jgi:hypothetical protein
MAYGCACRNITVARTWVTLGGGGRIASKGLGRVAMNHVAKLKSQWSDFEIALLTEMSSRGDLLAEAADTLDRRLHDIRQKVDELGLTGTLRPDFDARAA